MRLISFAFLALYPFAAQATDLHPGRTPADAGNPPARLAALADASQTTASTQDALACGDPRSLAEAESEWLRNVAVADADAYADRLDELPAKAQATIKNLGVKYGSLSEDTIKLNYTVAVCERLKEKGVGAETLRPALASLDQALGSAATAAAQPAPEQPPAATPSQQVAATEPPATAVEPKAPEAAPTAPEPTAPKAPSDIQPPSTAAEGPAPAAVARTEMAEQPKPDTKVEQAPAGVPQDPAATEQKAENAAPAAIVEPKPETAQPSVVTEQKTESAPPEEQKAEAAPAGGPSPQPGAPGAEQPAAPHTSTMAQGDAPAGQPQGALTPGAIPEPNAASPGSTEQPAVTQTPAMAQAENPAPAPSTAAPADTQPSAPSAPVATADAPPSAPAAPQPAAEQPAAPQTPAATAEASPPEPAPQPAAPAAEQPAAPQTPTVTAEASRPDPSPQPGAPGAEQPAAPHTSTMAQGDAPAGQPQGAITAGPTPEPNQASPGSSEQAAASPTPAPNGQAENQPTGPAPSAAPPSDNAAAAPQAPAATADAGRTEPAPQPGSQGSEQPAPAQAPTTTAEASPPEPAPQPAAPGAEQPAAPQTSTMAQGEAPGGQPQGAITAGPTPEPMQASPGSPERSAAAEPPAAPAAPAAPAQTAQAPAAAPAPMPQTPAPGAVPPPAPELAAASPASAAPPAPQIGPNGIAQFDEEQCRALGVMSNCQDLNNVLAQLLEKPLEYNQPKTMYLYRKTEVGLVLRTDWEGKDLPPQASEEFKNLSGDVKQGLTKITRVMSAELSGGGFEVAPSGRQERTVVIPQPVTWNWQVKPSETAGKKTLKLQLFAHIEGPNGTMPPLLVKTLDTDIDVDVRTWDWVLAQIRGLEPTYAVLAVLLGLLTAVLTYFFTRRSEEPAGGPRSRGPVIGDLDQTGAAPRSRDEDDPRGA